MSKDDYLKNLAFQLRWRRMPEAEVAQALREVQVEAAAAGQDPAQLFGPEKAYAASFAKGKSTSPGFWVITVAMLIAVALVVSRIVTAIASDGPSNPLVSLGVLVGAAAIAFLGAIVGAALDHRMPEGVAQA